MATHTKLSLHQRVIVLRIWCAVLVVGVAAPYASPAGSRRFPSVGLQGEAPMRRPVLTCGTHLLGTEEDSDEVHRAGAVGVRG